MKLLNFGKEEQQAVLRQFLHTIEHEPNEMDDFASFSDYLKTSSLAFMQDKYLDSHGRNRDKI